MEFSNGTESWPPEQTVFAVPRVELRVLSEDHPVHLENSAEIRANWDREIAANPALFDGRMVLHRKLSVGPDGIAGEGHVVPFSTFLWWRRQAIRDGAFHVFGYAVIATADGALVAIRMGQHTANPGLVYFAAGSLDENDIVDGHCDMDGNIRREVLEETGLDLHDAVADDSYYASHLQRAVTVFRVFRLPLTAEEIVARIERHMPVADDKEIAGAVIIRSADPKAAPYHASMLPILDWFFGGRR